MTLVTATDLGLIVTDFLNDRRRCMLLGEGGGGVGGCPGAGNCLDFDSPKPPFLRF